MNDDIIKNIQDRVLERIERGEINMRSRAYFALKLAFTVGVALIVLALSVFVLSFIVFSIHESGEQFLLGFGIRGITTFIALFPWLLFAVDIVLILFLEWTLQWFSFGYRVSLLMLFLAVFAVSGVLAAFVAFSPLHPALLGRADRGELPLIGDLYEGVRTPHEQEGIFRGTVRSVGDGHIVVDCNDSDRDTDEGLRTILLPPGAPTFQIGERVYVFGSSTGATVEAYGIEHLPTR